MRSVTLAVLLLMGLRIATAADLSSVDTETEKWFREFLGDLLEKTQAHRDYLELLLTLALAGASALGAFVGYWSWQNRKDMKQIAQTITDSMKQKAHPKPELSKTEVRFILELTLSKYEDHHLNELDKLEEYPVQYSDALVQDIRRLEALDFINGVDNEPGNRAIARMTREKSRLEADFDLKQFFQVAERGKRYLEYIRASLRDEGRVGKD